MSVLNGGAVKNAKEEELKRPTFTIMYFSQFFFREMENVLISQFVTHHNHLLEVVFFCHNGSVISQHYDAFGKDALIAFVTIFPCVTFDVNQ